VVLVVSEQQGKAIMDLDLTDQQVATHGAVVVVEQEQPLLISTVEQVQQALSRARRSHTPVVAVAGQTAQHQPVVVAVVVTELAMGPQAVPDR
jgi:hypothetical protein